MYISFMHVNISIFTAEKKKNLCILHGQVFVMNMLYVLGPMVCQCAFEDKCITVENSGNNNFFSDLL